MLTFEKLVEGFRELGVEEGDTLLVHSSYKSLGEGGRRTADGDPCPGSSTWPGRDADHADVQF